MQPLATHLNKCPSSAPPGKCPEPQTERIPQIKTFPRHPSIQPQGHGEGWRLKGRKKLTGRLEDAGSSLKTLSVKGRGWGQSDKS